MHYDEHGKLIDADRQASPRSMGDCGPYPPAQIHDMTAPSPERMAQAIERGDVAIAETAADIDAILGPPVAALTPEARAQAAHCIDEMERLESSPHPTTSAPARQPDLLTLPLPLKVHPLLDVAITSGARCVLEWEARPESDYQAGYTRGYRNALESILHALAQAGRS